MKCESRFLKWFIALRSAQTLAAALLVAAIFIGALGVATPALQAQQAGNAAPTGSHNAAPPPKATTPPPAESTTEILNRIANSDLPATDSGLVSLNTPLHNSVIPESTNFNSERKV